MLFLLLSRHSYLTVPGGALGPGGAVGGVSPPAGFGIGNVGTIGGGGMTGVGCGGGAGKGPGTGGMYVPGLLVCFDFVIA